MPQPQKFRSLRDQLNAAEAGEEEIQLTTTSSSYEPEAFDIGGFAGEYAKQLTTQPKRAERAAYLKEKTSGDKLTSIEQEIMRRFPDDPEEQERQNKILKKAFETHLTASDEAGKLEEEAKAFGDKELVQDTKNALERGVSAAKDYGLSGLEKIGKALDWSGKVTRKGQGGPEDPDAFVKQQRALMRMGDPALEEFIDDVYGVPTNALLGTIAAPVSAGYDAFERYKKKRKDKPGVWSDPLGAAKDVAGSIGEAAVQGAEEWRNFLGSPVGGDMWILGANDFLSWLPVGGAAKVAGIATKGAKIGSALEKAGQAAKASTRVGKAAQKAKELLLPKPTPKGKAFGDALAQLYKEQGGTPGFTTAARELAQFHKVPYEALEKQFGPGLRYIGDKGISVGLPGPLGSYAGTKEIIPKARIPGIKYASKAAEKVRGATGRIAQVPKELGGEHARVGIEHWLRGQKAGVRQRSAQELQALIDRLETVGAHIPEKRRQQLLQEYIDPTPRFTMLEPEEAVAMRAWERPEQFGYYNRQGERLPMPDYVKPSDAQATEELTKGAIKGIRKETAPTKLISTERLKLDTIPFEGAKRQKLIERVERTVPLKRDERKAILDTEVSAPDTIKEVPFDQPKTKRMQKVDLQAARYGQKFQPVNPEAIPTKEMNYREIRRLLNQGDKTRKMYNVKRAMERKHQLETADTMADKTAVDPAIKEAMREERFLQAGKTQPHQTWVDQTIADDLTIPDKTRLDLPPGTEQTIRELPEGAEQTLRDLHLDETQLGKTRKLSRRERGLEFNETLPGATRKLSKEERQFKFGETIAEGPKTIPQKRWEEAAMETQPGKTGKIPLQDRRFAAKETQILKDPIQEAIEKDKNAWYRITPEGPVLRPEDLTPEERAYADILQEHFDRQYERLKGEGVLAKKGGEQYAKNPLTGRYVPRIFNRKQDNIFGQEDLRTGNRPGMGYNMTKARGAWGGKALGSVSDPEKALLDPHKIITRYQHAAERKIADARHEQWIADQFGDPTGTGEPMVNRLGQEVFVEESLYNALKNAHDQTFQAFKTSAMNKFWNFWKEMRLMGGVPAYMLTNMSGDMFLMYANMGAKSLLNVGRAIKAWTKRGNPQWRKEMEELGVGIGQGMADIQHGGVRPGQLDKALRKGAGQFLPGVRAEPGRAALEGYKDVMTAGLRRIGMLWADWWDRISKTALYITARENGMSKQQAAKQIFEVLPDYTDAHKLTRFLRPAFPFANWSVHMGTIGPRTWARNPMMRTAPQHAAATMEREVEQKDPAPRWQSEQSLSMPIQPPPGVGEGMRMKLHDPVRDSAAPTAELFLKGNIEPLGLQANPLIKSGIETLAEKDLVSKKNLREGAPLGGPLPKGSRAATWLEDKLGLERGTLQAEEDQKPWLTEDLLPLIMAPPSEFIANLIAQQMGDPNRFIGDSRPTANDPGRSAFMSLLNRFTGVAPTLTTPTDQLRDLQYSGDAEILKKQHGMRNYEMEKAAKKAGQ